MLSKIGADAGARAAQASGHKQTVTTTVGLIVKNHTIENLLIGGPAMISQQLARGDVILKVDGRDVQHDDRDTLAARLVGSDVPGSLVCLQVRKQTTGELRDVLLARTAAHDIACKRRLFELLSLLKEDGDTGETSGKDGRGGGGVDNSGARSQLIQESSELWGRLVEAETQQRRLLLEAIKEQQDAVGCLPLNAPRSDCVTGFAVLWHEPSRTDCVTKMIGLVRNCGMKRLESCSQVLDIDAGAADAGGARRPRSSSPPWCDNLNHKPQTPDPEP